MLPHFAVVTLSLSWCTLGLMGEVALALGIKLSGSLEPGSMTLKLEHDP